jgi:hypothetical protein
MNNEARSAIVKLFCDNNHINIKTLPSNLKIVISETYAPYLRLTECLVSDTFLNRNNAFDGFFINMAHRVTNTMSSMVVLISTGHLQDAEIIARTVTESSLAIQYLLKDDIPENIAHYLASFYIGQKWKNDKWFTAANNKETNYHNDLIQDKNKIEEKAKDICRSFIESAGHQWPQKPRSFSVGEMFEGLGRSVEYRTVYRAMCGQTHQNQEDLINSLLYSLTENTDIEKQFKNEKHGFSIFICLWGVRYYLDALQSLGNHFNFHSVKEQSKLSLETILNQHAETLQQLKKCKHPNEWTHSIVEGI